MTTNLSQLVERARQIVFKGGHIPLECTTSINTTTTSSTASHLLLHHSQTQSILEALQTTTAATLSHQLNESPKEEEEEEEDTDNLPLFSQSLNVACETTFFFNDKLKQSTNHSQDQVNLPNDSLVFSQEDVFANAPTPPRYPQSTVTLPSNTSTAKSKDLISTRETSDVNEAFVKGVVDPHSNLPDTVQIQEKKEEDAMDVDMEDEQPIDVDAVVIERKEVEAKEDGDETEDEVDGLRIPVPSMNGEPPPCSVLEKKREEEEEVGEVVGVDEEEEGKSSHELADTLLKLSVKPSLMAQLSQKKARLVIQHAMETDPMETETVPVTASKNVIELSSEASPSESSNQPNMPLESTAPRISSSANESSSSELENDKGAVEVDDALDASMKDVSEKGELLEEYDPSVNTSPAPKPTPSPPQSVPLSNSQQRTIAIPRISSLPLSRTSSTLPLSQPSIPHKTNTPKPSLNTPSQHESEDEDAVGFDDSRPASPSATQPLSQSNQPYLQNYQKRGAMENDEETEDEAVGFDDEPRIRTGVGSQRDEISSSLSKPNLGLISAVPLLSQRMHAGVQASQPSQLSQPSIHSRLSVGSSKSQPSQRSQSSQPLQSSIPSQSRHTQPPISTRIYSHSPLLQYPRSSQSSTSQPQAHNSQTSLQPSRSIPTSTTSTSQPRPNSIYTQHQQHQHSYQSPTRSHPQRLQSPTTSPSPPSKFISRSSRTSSPNIHPPPTHPTLQKSTSTVSATTSKRKR
ncbi:hypothetical protein BCR33DRAFT_722583 [Rhizoclosmatium globosum]|uniref:Uncharacterized protein n=1 Tax=Rhizoclosmatium globosum TaxID=329046 RepID=A0A1Y2BKE2_9FUNG|nr:hypothetical protein BCR33DRAFT_722583 [Rhizoclosmatium globosum]|eukprot:ORY35246.1 hypothetical protein BCR33DRAFT_722583 [Rhizoclosmatium globosum]